MKIQGIYKIVNKITNKIYIGQSTNIEYRIRQHKSISKNNKRHPLYASIRKHGLANFDFIIIEEVKEINKLDEREQYWLDHYQSYLPEKGYNIRIKAESQKGFTHSDQTKNKISFKNKGKKRKPYTEEHKLKLSMANKGKKLSESHITKLKEAWKNRAPMSKETKLKIGLGNKGKTVSEKSRLKMSLASKGKPKSEEHRKKLSEANIGKHLTQEHKNKISVNHSRHMLGKTFSKETIIKMALAKKGKKRKPYKKSNF